MSTSPSNEPLTPEPQPIAEVPKIPENENENENESQNLNPQSTDPSSADIENGNQEVEEEGECGFCLFMKGGECRETFINWEKCVQEGEKNGENIVKKCFDARSALTKCMAAHPNYYGVILQAEKDAEQEVNNQLNQDKEEQVAVDSKSEERQQTQESQ